MIGYLQDWFLNLIIIMIIILIIDLMTPQSTYTKYVRFVTGLLLMMFIITPIFHLLSLNIPEWIESKQMELTDDSLFENKKNEIETEVETYTLEQTAMMLKNKAEEGLNFDDPIIQTIELATENNEITHILVTLDQTAVVEVVGGQGDIVHSLATIWNVPTEMIRMTEVRGVE